MADRRRVVGRQRWKVVLALAAMLASGGKALPQDRTMTSLAPAQQVAIREVADGAGPSHVIPVGRYVLVVDPWSSEIRRYLADDLQAPPAICLFPRSFAPGRTERTDGGVRLIAEPFGPGLHDRYDLRSRSVMTITAGGVAAMGAAGPCRFPLGGYDPRLDTPPAIRWVGGDRPGSPVLFAADGVRARITPEGGPGARVFAVRKAGALSGGRSLLWWSEIDDQPGKLPEAQGQGMSGRVAASQYVGVVERDGGAPLAVVRIETAVVPPLRPDMSIPVPALLVKPGLEYIAGSAAGGGASLWIVAADMDAASPRSFVLRRYDLTGLAAGARAQVSLVPPSRKTVPLVDRNDRVASDVDELPQSEAAPAGPVPYAKVAALLREQVSFRWRYPSGAAERPCGGRDRCPVGANEKGVLGAGPGYPNPVVDLIAKTGGAEWMRPRHLIGLPPGAMVRSVPYSIGGKDLATDFTARLAAGYVGGSIDSAPPVGHIREGMEWRGADLNYPLGIDCSALLAKVFDVGIRSTGHMVRANVFRTADGQRYSLPTGPDRGCPQPVRRFADLRSGDVLLRNGHVVIFNGFTRIGNAPGRSKAVRVFEATSRCGAVCESVYDPTYFAGWWMLRLDPANCPDWLGAEPARKRED